MPGVGRPHFGLGLLQGRLGGRQLGLGLRLLALRRGHRGPGRRPRSAFAPSTAADASSTPAVDVISVTSAPKVRESLAGLGRRQARPPRRPAGPRKSLGSSSTSKSPCFTHWLSVT